jgi:hypothetical protein
MSTSTNTNTIAKVYNMGGNELNSAVKGIIWNILDENTLTRPTLTGHTKLPSYKDNYFRSLPLLQEYATKPSPLPTCPPIPTVQQYLSPIP